MSEEKFQYEGAIDSAYKKKTILKVNIFLIPSFGFMIFLYGLLYFFGMFSIDMFTWLSLLTAVFPYFVIMIPLYFYLGAYVRAYHFKISGNNIIIFHGVFTKTKATIPFSRIQNINVVNGVFDRMYGIFTVKIETAGQSGMPSGGGGGYMRPEGLIPGLKDPNIIEDKIKEMIIKFSQIPSGLEDKIFKPEELAFDNFIGYILSKMREAEKLKTSIKELREKANMTAAKLAEKVGVPIQTINYLEEGRYNPSLTLAYRIAEVLNCKIEDLFKMG